MTALYVHTTILWGAFFGIMAAPPRSLMLRRCKQLAAIDFMALVIEAERIYA